LTSKLNAIGPEGCGAGVGETGAGAGETGAGGGGVEATGVAGTDGAVVTGTDGAGVTGTDGAGVAGTDGAGIAGAAGAGGIAEVGDVTTPAPIRPGAVACIPADEPSTCCPTLFNSAASACDDPAVVPDEGDKADDAVPLVVVFEEGPGPPVRGLLA
jgi:hypothetical protein